MSSHSVHTACTQVRRGVRAPTAHAQLCAEHPVLHDVWGDGAHLAHHGEQPENSEWMSSPVLISHCYLTVNGLLSNDSRYSISSGFHCYCIVVAALMWVGFNGWRSVHWKRHSQVSEKMWCWPSVFFSFSRRQTLMMCSATTPVSWTTAWRTACWPTPSFSGSSLNSCLSVSSSQTACRFVGTTIKGKCFRKKNQNSCLFLLLDFWCLYLFHVLLRLRTKFFTKMQYWGSLKPENETTKCLC